MLRSVVAEADGGSKGPARPGDDAAGFLDWAASAVEDGIRGRRSIRVSAPCCPICFVFALSDMHMQLEDPGKLIQTGYSAGARSKPQFDWVRNILRKQELSPDFIASSDHRTSCLFAIAWNICRTQLPATIMDPWIAFNEANKLPRMDGGLRSTATTGDVTIELGGDPVTFHGMDLAPACGMMGQNYSRSGFVVKGATALLTLLCFLLARRSHNEKQPHPFAIQWLLRRNKGAGAGAHFYITSYGTKIVNSSNTLIAWQP